MVKSTYITAAMAAVIVLLLIVIIVMAVKRKRDELRYFAYQDKLLSGQLQETNNIYMSIRGFRHDYHNHMQTIRAHLALGQTEEADRYIDRMENELEKIDFKYKTGNVNVDAILNGKLSLAEKNNIRVKCDAGLQKELGINPVDLCVILGNLIDNAIESCEKMDEEADKFIRVYMCIKKSNLYISVTNSTGEVIRKSDKEYITNKRGNHGHGLRRINLAVEKYEGYINRKNEPGAFATEILLPMSDLE